MVINSHTRWGRPSTEHPWVNRENVDGVTPRIDYLRTWTRLVSTKRSPSATPIYEWTDYWYAVEAATAYDRPTGIDMIDQFEENAPVKLREFMVNESLVGFRLGAIRPHVREVAESLCR